ncbi:MAG: hypothetical protein IKS96_02705 [Fibrobacter sp.]|nr:hypothetical protein [Bacteroidaceae bacterium]MBR6448853.1 hypothetical protein [Fibrobacter sp.]
MKFQVPWLGKAAGRSAGTIYQTYWGATYGRSMPTLFHYPDTAKQQETQGKFFDLMKPWVQIYNQLSPSISKQQRVNKNPFNIMSGFIYKIFHPYTAAKVNRYPSNFGVDRLNRVRPVITDASIDFKGGVIALHYENQRPYTINDLHIDTSNVLLLNITKQSMLFVQMKFVAGPNDEKLENTNEWGKDDEILFYVALSCPNWLGNFNLFPLCLS